MTIEKKTSGTYKGLWMVRAQVQIDGKMYSSKRQYVKTKTEAKHLEEKLKAELRESQTQSVLDQRFDKAFDSYIEKRQVAWSVTTLKAWRFTQRRLSEYMPHYTAKIRAITYSDIFTFARSYQQAKQLKVSKDGTLNRTLQHLRTFFRAEQVNPSPCPPSPMRAIFNRREISKPVREKVTFTDSEIHRLKAKIFSDLKKLPVKKQASRVMILILLDTGMRPEEAQALQWSDLMNEQGYHVFTLSHAWSEQGKNFTQGLKGRYQGQTHRTLPLTRPVYEALMEYRSKQDLYLHESGITDWGDLLFPVMTDYRMASQGKPITQTTPRLLLQDMCKQLGIDKHVTLYTCRHTVASAWVKSSRDWTFVADRMGTSILQLQKTYAHASQDPAEVGKLLASQDA